MRFATIVYNEIEHPCVYIEGKGYYLFNDLFQNKTPKTLLEYIQNPITDFPAINSIPHKDATLCAPIPRPFRNVICLGKNYADHAKEVVETKLTSQDDSYIPKYPVYFTKSAYPAVGHNSVVPLHGHFTQQVDYEAELAVIIGKEARCIQEDEAEDVIFGYTILNDITARDVQTMYGQWFFGKSLDGFCSMGPYIVTKDEIPFPVELNVSCRVNGETRQGSNTSMLIYGIPRVISDISQGITLYPGDIIATGTPAGVGHAKKPPVYLKTGDVVECEIERIGVLSNLFR